jgi:hypothetical protein
MGEPAQVAVRMVQELLLLLLLLYRMLPDITSNTWAKKHFYNFL